MNAPVEVLEIRRLTDSGNLKGFAKVKIGCFVIHGCRIVQQPEQRARAAGEALLRHAPERRR